MKLSILFCLLLIGQVLIAQNVPTGLQVNDKAPQLVGKDQFGKEITLNKLVKKGPVVILFYRGEWCPYCNKQLSQLQDSISYLTKKGATVLAITAEKPENISKTMEKTKASYSIIYDEGLKIMNAYKVAFKVDDETIDKYKKYGIDFEKANGSNGANLPVPAVYVIDKKGKIIFRHFDPDYRKRASIREIASSIP